MKTLQPTPKVGIQYILNSLTEPTTIYSASGVYGKNTEIAENILTPIGENRETNLYL